MHIREALIKLLIEQPFYGALASILTIQESDAVNKTEMTLLPAPTLKYNVKWYEGLSDAHAAGALMHELLHLILLHPLRRGGRDPLLWAVCCDMAVNGHIPGAMLPESAVTTEKIELLVKRKLERMGSAEYYYDALSSLLNDSISFLTRDGAVTLPSVSGAMLEADVQKEEDVNYADEAALNNKLNEIVKTARQNGELPPGLSHEFDIRPKRSKIDWQNMFRRFLSGKGRMQIRATYKRDSRRFEGFPGHKRSVGLKLLIALDESGSISDGQLDVFYGELMSINRVPGADVMVTEFDTECSEPMPAHVYLRQRNRVKKGGTDFSPVFRLADKHNIFSVVIFTDGNGDAPAQVNQRVLWILTRDGRRPAPYGYCVKFEE